MDELSRLRAQIIADRFLVQALWANFIRFTGSDFNDIAARARAELGTAVEGLDHSELATAMLDHLDRQLQAIGDHLEGQSAS